MALVCCPPLSAIDSGNTVNTGEHLDQIDRRLDAIEAIIGSAPSRQPAGRSEKILRWCSTNKLSTFLIAVITLIAAVGGIFWSPLYQRHLDADAEAENQHIDSRIDTKLNPISQRLDKIDQAIAGLQGTLNTLQPFIQTLVQHEMQRSAQQSQVEFQKTLPVLSDTLAAAESQKATVDAATLLQLSKKVLAVPPKSAGYWPVASRLISYRSQVLTNWSNARPDLLADCLDQMPTPTKVVRKIDQTHLEISPAIYQHCRVSLDSSKDDQRINNLLWNHYWRLLFKDCVVEYHGNPVSLILAWNHNLSPASPGENTVATILFQNCQFSFSSSPSPGPNGFDLARRLLAQNGSILSLTIQPSAAGE